MPVTLYGINSRGQEFRSYVTPDEVDFYIKEKGLYLEPIEVSKVEEKPVEKEAEKLVEKTEEKPRKGRPKKDESE